MNRKTFIYLPMLILVLFIYNSMPVLAQSGATTASITGVITDKQGAAIGGAIVIVKDINTNFTREIHSGEDGSFSVNQLPPGLYEVMAQAEGFSTSTSKVDLGLGSTQICKFSLPVGASSDIIEVTASSGVDEDKTESSTSNDRSRIEGLPINRRNFLDFSLTSPRVTPDRTPQQGVAASSGISFNGLPARNNYITIDGLDNNDPLPGAVRSTFSQEAVQEFQVVSDSYSAEFGRALGGVINIVTRGGTNDLRGSIFFLNRNDSLSARNAFSPTNPEFKQYQFGATLGGPIKKDKAFFFTSFERLSVKQNSIVGILANTVQSAARQGFNVQNGPIPFGIGTTTFLTRIDTRISTNDTLYIRYNYGRTFNGASEPFGDLISGSRVADTNGARQSLTDNNIAFNNIYTNTGLNLTNETRFLYNRREQNTTPIDPNGPQINIVAPEGLVVFGRGTLLPQPRKAQITQIINTTALNVGRQQLKFGIDFDYTRASGYVPIFGGGFALFGPLDLTPFGGSALTGLQTFDPTLRTPQQVAQLTQVGMALGVPGLAQLPLPTVFAQGYIRTSGPTTKANSKAFSTFIQDDIKVNPNLLVKLGLRYDITRVTILDPNGGNFSPRVAFAYHPKRLPKLNIHGAYGIFVASTIFGPAFDANASALGDLKIVVLPFPNSIGAFLSPNHRLPLGEDLPPGVTLIPQLSLKFLNERNPKSSYSQQVNFGFDYLIGKNTSLSLIYDYVRGNKIFSQRNINPITNPVFGNPVANALMGRPDSTQGDIFEFTNAYDSYYNAFSVVLNRHFNNHIGLIASYTFAKAIDNFIDIRNELQQAEDPTKLRNERGLSLQDLRNRFNLSGIWELNYTKNRFLTGFQLSTIINVESGRPYNLLAGVDVNMNGDNPPGDRPRLGGVPIARDSGLTPGFINVDLRLTRSFSFKEHYQLQGFIEAFNLFNRTNISDIDPIYLPVLPNGDSILPLREGSRFRATPDRYRASFAPRQFQVGFKLNF